MSTFTLRKHEFAGAKERPWQRTQPQGFGHFIVDRLHPTAEREDVAGGFVWWVDTRIVAECQMNPHRGTWFGWCEGR